MLATLTAALLLAAACSGSGTTASNGESGDGSDFTACERERLAAALGLADATELPLQLDPADEPLADILRDICALDSTAPGVESPPETQVRSPVDERDAGLPAALVRAPALFEPDDAPPGTDPALD